MKILALDTSSSGISLCAENGDIHISLYIESGLHHAEKIVPAIELILEKAEIKPRELDFGVLGKGPGSFTGLRLAFAAMKALQLTAACPLYGVSTLAAYAAPYSEWPGAVVAAIDARKNKFYSSVFRQKEETAGPMDAEAADIAACLDPEETVLAAGPDALLLKETLLSVNPQFDIRVISARQNNIAEVMLEMGKKQYEQKAPPLADYDGPVYLRKSEAEEKK